MLKGGGHHGRDERGAGPHCEEAGATSVMALERVPAMIPPKRRGRMAKPS